MPVKDFIIRSFTCWSDECLLEFGVLGMFLQAWVLAIIGSIVTVGAVSLYCYLKYKN